MEKVSESVKECREKVIRQENSLFENFKNFLAEREENIRKFKDQENRVNEEVKSVNNDIQGFNERVLKKVKQEQGNILTQIETERAESVGLKIVELEIINKKRVIESVREDLNEKRKFAKENRVEKLNLDG